MSLSSLLSSKDKRDKLIVARTPKKTVQATDFWSRSFQRYALESKHVPRPSSIVEGKDCRSPGMLFRGRQDERW